MLWKEITVHTTSEASDLVADIFFCEGGNGVCISDKKDIIELYSKKQQTWDYVDEDMFKNMSDVVLVKGFVPSDLFEQKLKKLNTLLSELKENSKGFIKCGTLEIISRDIDDEDWINVWKKHYKPIYIKDIVICPKWIELKEEKKAVVLLDPGMAFGTGEHETTNMCIELMQDYNIKDKNIIDLGCGSGILGICALKLGANSAYMTDFDPLAVSASKLNSSLNNVSGRAKIVCGNLLDTADVKGDIILINIVADVLISLSFDIGRFLNNSGTLILSGIIKSRLADVIKAYEKAGFIVNKTISKGEWCAVAARYGA